MDKNTKNTKEPLYVKLNGSEVFTYDTGIIKPTLL